MIRHDRSVNHTYSVINIGIDFERVILWHDLYRLQFRWGTASKGLAFRDDGIPFLSDRRPWIYDHESSQFWKMLSAVKNLRACNAVVGRWKSNSEKRNRNFVIAKYVYCVLSFMRWDTYACNTYDKYTETDLFSVVQLFSAWNYLLINNSFDYSNLYYFYAIIHIYNIQCYITIQKSNAWNIFMYFWIAGIFANWHTLQYWREILYRGTHYLHVHGG